MQSNGRENKDSSVKACERDDQELDDVLPVGDDEELVFGLRVVESD